METITRTFDAKYLETWVPPRCRKPRYRVVQESMIFGIASYSDDEAPVAFVVSGSHFYDGEIRWDGARCYKRLANGEEYDDWGAWLANSAKLFNGNYEYYETESRLAGEYNSCSRENLVRKVETILSDTCLIDGTLWRACDEPGWKSMTWWSEVSYASLNVEPIASAEWNALQKDEARAEVVAPRKTPVTFLADERIEVLMPDAVKSDPHGKELADERTRREKELAKALKELEWATDALEKAVREEETYREAHEGAAWLHAAA